MAVLSGTYRSDCFETNSSTIYFSFPCVCFECNRSKGLLQGAVARLSDTLSLVSQEHRDRLSTLQVIFILR